MSRTIAAIIIVISCMVSGNAYGQKNKEKAKKKAEVKDEKVPVFNYVIDDPMDAFGRTPDTSKPTPTLTLQFPEFYSYNPVRTGDTTFQYICYDRRDSLINVDTLHDIDLVRYISLFINYTDHDHNYRDANGQIQPLPVSKIIRRYDKLGTDRWMSIDYATNKYTELRENKNEIVRTETVNITHPVTHAQFSRRHNYYRAK